MTWTGKWLSTTAISVLAACSSGVDTETTGPASNSPPLSENAPPLNSSAPPLSDQSPALNPQAPPASEDSSSSEATCTVLCSALQSAGCAVPDCVGSCSSSLPDFGSCTSQYVAVMRCLIAQPGFNCGEGLGDVSEDDANLSDDLGLEACYQQVLDLVQCAGTDLFDMGDGGQAEWTDAAPSVEACTLAGDACAGCEDDCEQCRCLNEYSDAVDELCAEDCGG